MVKSIFLWISLAAISFCLKNAQAQTNSRNWVNLSQVMVGGQPSMTSTAFSSFNSIEPFKYYALAVNPVGGASWDVRLEGSLDQISWSTILLNSSVTQTSSAPIYQPNASPALYLRLRAATLSGTVTATAIGVP